MKAKGTTIFTHTQPLLCDGDYNNNTHPIINLRWVSVSLTGKVFDGCIRDLGFNPRLHQKLIGVLV